jgi:hypothetical protein
LPAVPVGVCLFIPCHNYGCHGHDSCGIQRPACSYEASVAARHVHAEDARGCRSLSLPDQKRLCVGTEGDRQVVGTRPKGSKGSCEASDIIVPGHTGPVGLDRVTAGGHRVGRPSCCGCAGPSNETAPRTRKLPMPVASISASLSVETRKLPVACWSGSPG